MNNVVTIEVGAVPEPPANAMPKDTRLLLFSWDREEGRDENFV